MTHVYTCCYFRYIMTLSHDNKTIVVRCSKIRLIIILYSIAATDMQEII